ncbi:unnamed protein product [Penicillium pancosmium]
MSLKQSTPEKQVEDLIKRQNLTEDEVWELFDKLKPIGPDHFTGAWKGGSVNTNHPTEGKMEALKWAGKDFRSTEDVDPIMVYKEDGSRAWNEDWGHARLRPMQYRGGNTTAMIYDDKPIIDYFKYVNDTLLLGAMDAKSAPGTFFFYLYK